MPVNDTFPAQPPAMVQKIVTVSHFNLNQVKELVEAHPSLVNASWDWGFGDWETPLGAASHMGNRPIAEYLRSKGAPESLFSAAMLGHLDVVKSLLAAQPGIHQIRGPHSISLLNHSRMGGDTALPVFELLQPLPGVDLDIPVPLTPQQQSALVGTYIFGDAPTDQIEINADTKIYASKMYTALPQLNWTRKGTMTRPLFHLGDSVFYPAGAPTVRITFTSSPAATTMTVTHAAESVTATRTP
jgi:hypothetical protein